MRRLVLPLLLLLLTGCARPAETPVVEPPPAPVVEPLAVTVMVSGSPDGPWLPYRPGIHVPGERVWMRITANRALSEAAAASVVKPCGLTCRPFTGRGSRA